MGLGGIGIWQLLIILAIVVMLFGTKRLRNMGSDLGAAIKGFRSSVGTEEDDTDDKKLHSADEPDPAAAQKTAAEKVDSQ